MKTQPAVTIFVALAVAASAASFAAPPKPSPDRQLAATVGQPAVAVIPMADLDLTEVRLTMVEKHGTMPGGQPCWIFNLQAVFHNAGQVATGPFKVVWERADAEAGPYTIPCAACTENIANAAPGVGMLPPPRQFNNCGGPKWYQVRLDPDNKVRESKEGNNLRKVRF